MDRSRPRDVLVTGLGFCLPGPDGPVLSPADLWAVAARGRTALVERDGVHYGTVDLSPELFADRLPDVPGVFADHLSPVQRFGLMSLVEACQDAKLDVGADLTAAAVLVGRGGIDTNVPGYRALSEMDPDRVTAEQAMGLFLGGEMTATPSDVALMQGSVTRTTGPCWTASAGCASSSVQLQTARLLIAAGEVDLAVVTGVDAFDPALVVKSQALVARLQGGSAAVELPTTLTGLMRPYDRRAGVINFGEGAATVVLESRAHAERRGAHAYGSVLAHAVRRDGLAHPLTGDPGGSGLVDAVRRCLGDRWELPPYVHGASDGDAQVTELEANAVRTLYGPAAGDLLVSSHEGCFGHNGASAGVIGVGLTLLMMERGEVCPTANCEEPADDLPFDPVPGTATRRLDFDRALSLSYQIGGVKSVVLLAGSR